MQVKIGNTIYDSEQTPIMLILSQEDKNNISKMVRGSYKYCSFPDYYKQEGIIEFMKTDEDKPEIVGYAQY